MMRSRFLQLLIVILLVISFTVSPVRAQYEPQAGTVDEDGELVVESLPTTSVGITGMPEFDPSLLDRLPGAGVSADSLVGVDVVLISPVTGAQIKEKTPTFIFSKDALATKYQIEVFDIINSKLVYTLKGSGACILTQCSFTPATKLKPVNIDLNSGYYAWRVRSRTSAGWGGYTPYSVFFVLSKGFNSTFDVNANKWLSLTGHWFRVDSGSLKTKGLTNLYATAVHKDIFSDDFVYTARIKGKGGVNQIQGLIIGGYPTPTWAENLWYDGVYFLHRNDSSGILVIRDGVKEIWSGWNPFSGINPTGWNVLEVTVNAPNAYLTINGQANWYLISAPLDVESGFVGLAHFRATADKNPLLVDWAKLSYLPTSTADGMEPDLNGAMVIDFNDLSKYPSQSGSPFDPPQ